MTKKITTAAEWSQDIEDKILAGMPRSQPFLATGELVEELAGLGVEVGGHVYVERMTLVGPAARKNEVYALLSDWRVTNCGPYTDPDLWPEVDITRFKVTLERAL
jgi:hypothetical protein